MAPSTTPLAIASGTCRRRHLHRHHAQRLDHLGADARRTPDLEALEFFQRLRPDLAEMQRGAVMEMHEDRLGALELVERVLLHVFPQRGLAVSAFFVRKGSSKTSDLVKRPAW
jgi:hypothetical protein